VTATGAGGTEAQAANHRRLRQGAAGPVGVAATLIVLAALSAVGLGVAWLALRGNPRSDQALAALLIAAVSALVAFAIGGWVVGRLAGRGGVLRGALIGSATGAVALLALAAAGDALAGDAADLRSARIALGLDEPAAGATIPGRLPITPPPTGALPTAPEELARQRSLRALAYAGAAGLLVLGAAALGGVAGTADGGTARSDRRAASARPGGPRRRGTPSPRASRDDRDLPRQRSRAGESSTR
jgi:hypothetical protein